MKIIDLHCDLTTFLYRHKLATAFDPDVRCSIPQLRKGGVKVQVLAIYAPTDVNSSQRGRGQAEIISWLPFKYPNDFSIVDAKWWESEREEIGIIPAIENASTMIGEDEAIYTGLDRIAFIDDHIGKIAYLSLTWNGENRFGGGAHTSIGIKEDGKRLLEFLDRRRIAIDLSHASDALAYDILNVLDQRGWAVPVIASHSNCRKVADVARNLPDELIGEIVERGGLIGLNFVKEFVGAGFAPQIEHLMKLGAGRSICFGADFFYNRDEGEPYYKKEKETYFPEYANASCYPALLGTLDGMSVEEKEWLSWKAAENFLREKIFKKEVVYA